MTEQTAAADTERPTTGHGPRVLGWLRRHPEVLLLVLYAVLLVALKPRDPFEWDEVLFMRALDHYDVAAHSPHPFGAPLHVAAGRVVRLVARDAALALQLVSILAALASLVLVWRVALHEGARRGAALAAAAGLAVMPGFLFYGNVGMSDVPALALTLVTVLLGLRSLEEPRLLPATALAAAAALGVRPHAVLALAGVAALVLWTAVRRREWRRLGVAVAVAVAASLVIWLPAILATGWKAYWTTIDLHSRYVWQVDRAFAFPRAPLGELASHWLVHPFGKRELALGVYVLVASGAVAWWRAGARRLVLLSAASVAVFMAGTACTLSMLWGVRYSLPELPFLALLAAGNLAWPSRAARCATALAAVGVGVMLAGWGREALLLRRSPAPIWAAAQHVRSHYEAGRTAVMVDPAFEPHARYVLNNGFAVAVAKDSKALETFVAESKTLVWLVVDPVPGAVTELDRRWDSRRLEQLSFWRNQRCLVQRPQERGAPRFAPSWQVGEGGFVVRGEGAVFVPPDGRAHVGPVCVLEGRASVRSAVGVAPRLLAPGECANVLLLPGPKGAAVVAAKGEWVRVAPVTLTPLAGPPPRALAPPAQRVERLAPAGAVVVPVAAHAAGLGEARWRTRLVLVNSSYQDARAVVAFLPFGASSAVARAAEHALLAGAYLRLDDVVGADKLLPGGKGASGALLVAFADSEGRALEDPGSVTVTAATFNAAAAAGEERAGGDLTPVPVGRGLTAGAEVRMALGAVPARVRAAVGAVALGPGSAKLELSLEGGGAAGRLDVPAHGHYQRPIDLTPGASAVRLRVVAAPGDTRVFPYVSLVDSATGACRYVLPGQWPDPGEKGAPTLPLVAFSSPRPARQP